MTELVRGDVELMLRQTHDACFRVEVRVAVGSEWLVEWLTTGNIQKHSEGAA